MSNTFDEENVFLVDEYSLPENIFDLLLKSECIEEVMVLIKEEIIDFFNAMQKPMLAEDIVDYIQQYHDIPAEIIQNILTLSPPFYQDEFDSTFYIMRHFRKTEQSYIRQDSIRAKIQECRVFKISDLCKELLVSPRDIKNVITRNYDLYYIGNIICGKKGKYIDKSFESVGSFLNFIMNMFEKPCSSEEILHFLNSRLFFKNSLSKEEIEKALTNKIFFIEIGQDAYGKKFFDTLEHHERLKLGIRKK